MCGVYDRGKTMSESKRVKVSSVAAFMFLPQFHLSLRGFAHIVPVFIRTVAMVFVASGLIPNNHPATRYGVEGIRKYSFFELVGEAWFNLRNTNASTQQWGIFFGVMMMMAALVSALVAFVLTVFFNLGAIAHAQIFTYPTDINGVQPYGAADATDLDALTALGPSVNGMFDTRTAVGGASQDYALMVLDKVVRQSAVGTGGAMQNALAGLMQVYNTGIMVVAAIIIFWMILSIVVDTAKTGIVGGGRHNMVWTPIRVVFALGIMIPLGTTGFSSGQFAVMKLAEWGSNFGSRAWATYVSAVVSNRTMLVRFTPEGAMQAVLGTAKVLTCQIAYNASARQVMGGAAGPVLIQPSSVYDPESSVTTTVYTNRANNNLCGTVSFPGRGALLGGDPNTFDCGGTPCTGDAHATYLLTELSNTDLTGDGLGPLLLAYRDAISVPVRAAVDEPGGSMLTEMRGVACRVAASVFAEDSGGANPVLAGAPCAPVPGSCTVNAEDMPTHTCLRTVYDNLRAAMTAAETTARNGLNTWIEDPVNGLAGQMTNRGWAGMGTWFMYVNLLNQAVNSNQSPGIVVQPGSLWESPEEARRDSGIAGFFGSTTTGRFETSERANAAIGRFDDWWGSATVTASAADPEFAMNMSGGSAFGLDEGDKSSGKGFVRMLRRASDDSSVALELIMRNFFSFVRMADLMQNGVDFELDNTYPLAQLVQTGEWIMQAGLNVILANTVLGLVLSVIPAGFDVDWNNSTLAHLIGTVGKGMFLGGLMISIYLPILPLLRVAFAVLTWITSVFEAVVMVPIAALAHLSSEGEGLAGGARTVWILWLNVLLRPVLVVLGFVGAMLVFNAFAIYFHSAFLHGVGLVRAQLGVISQILSLFTYTVVYVFTLYTSANTTFKMLDLVPDAMMRWIGGTPDKSFDDNNDGLMYMASKMITENRGSSFAGNWKKKGAQDVRIVDGASGRP